ncbi:MAG: sulfatase-like hydrolase/transferase [Bacteroidota bacterium]|nr:sulfatase-like hydrolase/transferase [Bacteroidota bacterium]
MFLVFFINEVADVVETSRIGNVSSALAKSEIPPLAKASPNIKRDVYYIIFDAYTNSKSLKEYWNYDNSSFMQALTNRGFYIAKDSHSNYELTPLSVSSSLNSNYHSFNDIVKNIPDEAQFYFKHKYSSSIINYFQSIGYSFINYSIFEYNKVPAIHHIITFNIDPLHNFYSFVFYQTCFGKIYDKAFSRLQKNTAALWQDNLETVEMVNELVQQKSDAPRFVYIHFVAPHPPYYFTENGSIRPESEAIKEFNKDYYLSQLIYTNTLALKTVDAILHHAHVAPIIIVQGDHGSRIIPGKKGDDEATSILNAFYFPDSQYQSLYPSISPVNTFRVVLNQFFNQNIPLLKDTSYLLARKYFFVPPEH